MYSDTFDRFIRYVLFAEGEYSDDVADRGGETNWGISARFLKQIDWRKAPPTRDQAIQLYREYFWIGYRCHEMHPLVAWCACDAYIQHPPLSASMMIQAGLGVTQDGQVGPLTINASKSPDLANFYRRYMLARVRFYNDILRSDSLEPDNIKSQWAFADGWHARLHKLSVAIFQAGFLSPEKSNIVLDTAKLPAIKATGIAGAFGALYVAITGTDIDLNSITNFKSLAIETGLLSIIVGWIAKLKLK